MYCSGNSNRNYQFSTLHSATDISKLWMEHAVEFLLDFDNLKFFIGPHVDKHTSTYRLLVSFGALLSSSTFFYLFLSISYFTFSWRNVYHHLSSFLTYIQNLDVELW